jgi:hypothetical protein
MCALRLYFAFMTVLSITDFIPANPVQLILTNADISRFISCYHGYHLNSECRTIVSDIT